MAQPEAAQIFGPKAPNTPMQTTIRNEIAMQQTKRNKINRAFGYL